MYLRFTIYLRIYKIYKNTWFLYFRQLNIYYITKPHPVLVTYVMYTLIYYDRILVDLHNNIRPSIKFRSEKSGLVKWSKKQQKKSF